MKERIVSITVIIAVVGGLFFLFAYNAIQAGKIDMTTWNDNMVIGDASTAKHHFVMYTDIFCPYCDKFSDAVMFHKDEFKSDYIEGKEILFELRITDMNYEAGHSKNSRPAGEGAYCAAKQNKFWDYYYGLLDKLYTDYHSKGIGIDKTAQPIPELEMDYFYKVAEKAGLDKDTFVSCMENHETADELDNNTMRASRTIGSGVPYFQFDKFTTAGFLGYFDPEDRDWEQAKLLLDAGLSGKNPQQ